jgi:nucleoside 2-deoxyribosyltransferase
MVVSKLVYLAGAIDFAGELDHDDRNELTDILTRLGCTVYNPSKAFSCDLSKMVEPSYPREAGDTSMDFLQTINETAIENCGIFIGCLPECNSVGTFMEIDYARALGIPIVCFDPTKRYWRSIMLHNIKLVDNFKDLVDEVEKVLGIK